MKLNYRFLNYKHYNTFDRDLKDDKILEDSIVFIQDKPCIWAHGKEYVCDGPDTADIQNGTFTFKNGKDKIIFSASQKDGVITLTDGNGNAVSQEYVLKDWFDNDIRAINRSIQTNSGNINTLNDNYVNLARDKQNKLIAGENIRIKDNIISAVVDADLYIITQSLDNIENPNPNKIYLLETVDQYDKITYQQYKYKDGEWISIGVTDVNMNMSEYLEQEYRYLQENYQPKGDYANKTWVEDTFVKKSSVYTPQDGISDGGSENSGGSSGIIIPSGNSNVVVDKNLSTTSSNPVENRTVTIALQNKVDNVALLQYAKKSDIADKVNSSVLNGYVTNIQHAQDLNSKQNLLTAGNGISINNNQISVTLDTDFMVVTRSLESVLNPNPNKIYLLEHTEDETTVYTEYRYDVDNSEWIEIGRKDPEINLEPYMTKVEAQAIHQNITDNYLSKAEAEANYQTIIDDYATKDELEQVDQKLEDYATSDDLDTALSYVKNEFQKKGNYIFAEQVSTALSVLQQIIDQKYVLKKDVYRPQETQWSTAVPTIIDVEGTEGSASGSTGAKTNMVTLTTEQYQTLVNRGLIDETTYYFTYEGEVETIDWTFGGTFPVFLAGEELGTLPITLK